MLRTVTMPGAADVLGDDVLAALTTRPCSPPSRNGQLRDRGTALYNCAMTRDGRNILLFDQDSPDAATLLRELHEQVLSASFSPVEYIPPTSFEPVDELALIACGDDGLVLGGALGEVYSTAVLLAYLATRRGLRGGGVGTKLLAAVRDRWLAQRPVTFVELDDPRYHNADPDYGDPAARLRFYGTLGTRLLAIPYFQPRLRNDLPRGYRAFLGIIPPDGTAPATMPASQVTEFLREYFEICEGIEALDDPEVRWLLDAVGEQPEIRVVGTDEYAGLPDSVPCGVSLPVLDDAGQ
jgi:GNAT superfamily N-acetyltransferase